MFAVSEINTLILKTVGVFFWRVGESETVEIVWMHLHKLIIVRGLRGRALLVSTQPRKQSISLVQMLRAFVVGMANNDVRTPLYDAIRQVVQSHIKLYVTEYFNRTTNIQARTRICVL